MKFIKDCIHELKSLHPLSRDILRGSAQFAVLLALFGAVLERTAVYTPDILESLRYAQAAVETAPALLLAGVACALAADLGLRKKAAERPAGKKGDGTKQAEKKTGRKPDDGSPPDDRIGPSDK